MVLASLYIYIYIYIYISLPKACLVWHWGDPEDAQVSIMCHRVATDTIPWALCVILAAPDRHNKNPLS